MSYFEIKEDLDKVFYRLFNGMSSLAFAVNFKLKRQLSANTKYKDLYKGKRCFVLGAGPSLKNLTIEQQYFLKKEITFGVNFLYRSEVTNIIQPTYYALFDNLFFTKNKFAFRDISEKFLDTTFITLPVGEKILEEEKIKNNRIVVYSKLYPIDRMQYDLTTNTHITFNVLSECIKAAIYMGFESIYLLGADYSAFAHPVEVHCYEDERNRPMVKNRLGLLLKYYALTTQFHYLLQKESKRKGVQIVNITPGSLLDAYEKKDLNDILI